MEKVFIIHGFNSSPTRNWFPWLSKELEKLHINNSILSMPTPRYPIKEEWIENMKNTIGNPNEHIFLVGHSLGSSAILRYLETLSNDQKIGGAVPVSGPINYVPGPGDRYDFPNKFSEGVFDFKHINEVCKKFVVIHGIDDHVIPFSNAEELSRELSCQLIPMVNGKHLNDKSGFIEFPDVLNSLLKMIN